MPKFEIARIVGREVFREIFEGDHYEYNAVEETFIVFGSGGTRDKLVTIPAWDLHYIREIAIGGKTGEGDDLQVP